MSTERFSQSGLMDTRMDKLDGYIEESNWIHVDGYIEESNGNK